MSLEDANYIYENYKNMYIRANGDSGNISPEKCSVNPEYIKETMLYLKENGSKKFFENMNIDVIDDKTKPRFISTYHIDSQNGLNILSKTIKERNINTEIITII